jgi:type III secretory pathway component EscS
MNTTEITNLTMQNWLMFAMIGWAIAGVVKTLVQIAQDRTGGTNQFLWWFIKFMAVSAVAAIVVMMANSANLLDAATYTIGGLYVTAAFPIFPAKRLAAKFKAMA